jgi:hypothetical protein
VEILSGLSEGETVVFGEQNQFKEGELVSPKLVDVPKDVPKEVPRTE